MPCTVEIEPLTSPALTSVGPSTYLPPRLHESLDGAGRRKFIAFELALEIRAPIGVNHGSDAHYGELLSELRKLEFR